MSTGCSGTSDTNSVRLRFIYSRPNELRQSASEAILSREAGVVAVRYWASAARVSEAF